MKLSQFIPEFMLSPTLALRFSIENGFSITVFPMLSYVTKDDENDELIFLYGHAQILTPDIEITHVKKEQDFIEVYNDEEIVVDIVSLNPYELDEFYEMIKDLGGEEYVN